MHTDMYDWISLLQDCEYLLKLRMKEKISKRLLVEDVHILQVWTTKNINGLLIPCKTA